MRFWSCQPLNSVLLHRLIQSAIDGYNVCIFAYGQTGSGKTYTMVGDKEQKNPGIMPRSFNAMFDIIQQNSNKFDFKVSDSTSPVCHKHKYISFFVCLIFLHTFSTGVGLYAGALQRQAAGPLCKPVGWGPCATSIPWPGQAGGDQEEQKGGCVCPRSRDKGGFQCSGAVRTVPAGLRQPTHLRHQWVLYTMQCHPVQTGPAKWFGLIVLVTVSVSGRYIITGLGGGWHGNPTVSPIQQIEFNYWLTKLLQSTSQATMCFVVFLRDECGEFPLPSHCWHHGGEQEYDQWECEHWKTELSGPGRQRESSQDRCQGPPAKGLHIHWWWSSSGEGAGHCKNCISDKISAPSLQEANSINKSLSALGDVISALSAELPHVPYRNSKLTQVTINARNARNSKLHVMKCNVVVLPLRWCRTH